MTKNTFLNVLLLSIAINSQNKERLKFVKIHKFKNKQSQI